MNRQDVKPATRLSYTSMLANHITPQFGKRDLTEILPTEISSLIEGLLSKYSRKTVTNVYQLLHVMFEVAVEEDLMVANPVRRKHRPKRIKTKLAIWAPEQVQRILIEAPDRWRAFLWCLALLSVRIGELLAIQRK